MDTDMFTFQNSLVLNENIKNVIRKETTKNDTANNDNSYVVQVCPTLRNFGIRNLVKNVAKRNNCLCRSGHLAEGNTLRCNDKLDQLRYLFPTCCAYGFNKSRRARRFKKLNKFVVGKGDDFKNWKATTGEISNSFENASDEDEYLEVDVLEVDEGYQVSESDTGSETEGNKRKSLEQEGDSCSGCSTLGGGTKRTLEPKVWKKTWRELKESLKVHPCHDTIAKLKAVGVPKKNNCYC